MTAFKVWKKKKYMVNWSILMDDAFTGIQNLTLSPIVARLVASFTLVTNAITTLKITYLAAIINSSTNKLLCVVSAVIK